MSEYMEFFKAGNTGKTEVYDVLSKSSGAILGHIKWYGAWRQYCFFPSPHCVFNNGCLGDIIGFVKDLMEERKRMKTKGINE
jgi:hypothetical protein